MQGTLVCGVTDDAENNDAVAEAAALSERLGLRLVLAHVADGIGAVDNGGDESITMKGERLAAEQRLAELAREHALDAGTERRIGVGDPAALLGQIATEEAADVIVVGARRRGWPRRGLESPLAQELETETRVPVLIAPPRTRRPRTRESGNGAPRR